tara:strand:+ start:247 stop:1023 length:777 start_codon:yes stop_codon:yes gene_type:complete
MATNRYYTPRIRVPDILERGKAFNAELPVYRDGNLVIPSLAYFRLVDDKGEDVIAETVATIVGNIAIYAISAGQIPISLEYSDSYMQYWNLTLAGEVYEFKRPCALARSALYPVVTDLDLEAEYSSLSQIRPAGDSSYQVKLDEAWSKLIQRIRNNGSLEYLIMSPDTLRDSHMNLTLYLIFKDASSAGMGMDNTYMEHAREHLEQYEKAFSRLQFKYDIAQDGIIDEKKRAGTPVIFTNKPPRAGLRSGRGFGRGLR